MKRFVRPNPAEPMTDEELEKLQECGCIETCPACRALNAHAYQDVTVDDDGELYIGETHAVYHIGAASCFEWQCGKCRAYVAPIELENGRPNPILDPCFTHSEEHPAAV